MINIVERAFWTGLQTGLALLSADSFGWLNANPVETLKVAAVATLLSVFKTLSQDRLRLLGVTENAEY